MTDATRTHDAAGAAEGFGARVSIRGVEKRFADVLALAPTELELDRGEFVTLLGPSGCGKSTLLRIIAGLEQPTTGRVLLDDADVTALPPERRHVNLVFQNYALFPHLDVRQNVAYGLRAAHVERGELERRVSEALTTMGLVPLSARRVGEISGGQAQRVALARALVNRPSVLLLDEPLAALDLKLREQMQVELRRIHRTFRTTFVYVTHDQTEALAMSDRIVVMNEGVVDQVGTPEEIYRSPATTFVASFVGESSLVPAQLLGTDDGIAEVRLEVAGSPTVSVPHRLGPKAIEGERVAVVLRPEALVLAPAAAARLRGRLVDIWFLGDRYAAAVDVQRTGGGSLLVRLEMPGHTRPGVAPGDEVGVDWHAEGIVVVPEAGA